MNDRVMALRVGIVLLAAGCITGFLIILLGEGRGLFQDRYRLHIKFPQAPGVAVDTPVRKDGVLIGRVTHVELRDEGGVVITAKIDEGRKVFQDEAARIATSSLLGDSVIEFVPDPNTTQPHAVYQDGDFIGNGRVAADPISVLSNLEGDVRETLSSFRTAADDVSNLSRGLQNALGGDADRMQRIMQKSEDALDQINRTAGNFNQIVGDPEVSANLKEGIRRLPQTLAEIESMMAVTRERLDGFKGMQERVERNLDNIEPFTRTLGEQGDELITDVNKIVRNVESMTAIGADLAQRISSADGSLAKFIRNDELYNKVNATVDNLHDASRRLRPILDDARVVSDKLARDPGGELGLKRALDRRPVGAGIKTLPSTTH